MHMNPKSSSPRNLSKRNRKRALQRRFHRALRELHERSGWTAKEFAERCQLPHRTVLNWLAGTASPGPRRLQELCRTFGWPEEESFEDLYLDYEKLTQRFLRLQPQDPLEAWGHVPLAGALMFVDLSAAGNSPRPRFEC
jgi:transcriptional regulator with XRE-family HTH domain